MKPHTIEELNQLFSDGESADQELFAEQRSNVQLVAGEHYAKKGNKFWNRVRESRTLTEEQKIRLTKNHVRRIVLIYRNSITTYAPGVTAGPKDKTSIQHQKTAELVNSVWQNAKQKDRVNFKINQWAHDFCSIGEVFVKEFFNPQAGRFLGYEAQMNEETGQPELDEQGQQIPSEIPRFAGDIEFERMFGFNIVRHSGSKNMDDSPFLCHKKMVEVKDLKLLVDASKNISDEDKKKIKQKIVETPDQTYVVLDGNSGHYKHVKGQCMLKEFYFKPCPEYPMGYFYICTESDIIFEGELPFGIWPIRYAGFDEIQTSPRYRSIVKQCRPYQIEINRTASKIAEHQITLGDDKVLIQNGTKLVPGVAIPGVRSFQYSGMTPTVMQGRSGDQYTGYMTSQIAEMYVAANVEEQKEEKPGNVDVFTQLYKSIKDKKKFTIYTDTFEEFLRGVFELYIQLAQKYFDDNHLIPAIGKAEYINISEFKNADPLCYSVNIEPQTDDSETKLGKQLALNHVIQYVGPQLAKDDLGKLIREMPYANDVETLEDLTMDYDWAKNYMLSLDRGQVPAPNQYDNHVYLIKKLTNRTRKPDFDLLHPFIKQNYMNAIANHEQLKTQAEIAIKQAQSEFIPTGGYLVACDFYVPDAQDPQKLPKRVRLPSEALSWLINQLDSQGSDQQTLEGLSQGAMADMSNMLLSKMRMAAQPQQQLAQTSAGGMNGY